METGSEMLIWPVASLGLVSPGAATEKNCRPFFITVNFIDFTRVSPLEGVTPELFHLSDLVSPLFYVNSPHNFFFHSGVTPLEDVTRGGPPPCDATEYGATKPEIDM